MNIEPVLNWVRDWLGIAPDYIVRKVYFRSLWPAMLLPILIGVGVLFTWYQYRRQSLLDPARRLGLGVLRVAAYIVLLLVIFQPTMALEKSVSIPRHVGVLLDNSQSMAHQDTRATPRELGDAALAMGKAQYLLPATQAEIARARVTLKHAGESLKPAKIAQALKFQKQAEGILDKALRDKALEIVPGSPNPTVVKVAETLKKIFQRQKGLSDKTEALSKLPPSPALDAQYADLSREQVFVMGDLDALGELLRDTLPVMAGAADAKLDRLSRLEMAKGILANKQIALLGQVAKDFRVPTFTFATNCESAGDGPVGLLAAKTEGVDTRVGDAIERACAQMAGQPLSGLILLTEGQSNWGTDPLEAARRMGKRDVPLYIVGLGLAKPKDVRLQSLIVPSAAFPKDKIVARLQLSGRGYEGLATELRATFDDKEIARLPVKLTEEPRFVEIPIEIPKDKKGEAKLAFSVPVQPGEDNQANNKLESVLKIFDQKIKVLYIEGKPRWEFRYLKVVLQRDTRLDVQFWMTEGDEDLPKTSPAYINGFPQDVKEAFKYDMVILGEVPGWKIQDQIPRIVELVKERSGSLLMIAGDNYAPATYADTPIGEILPVELPPVRDNVDVGPKVFPFPTGYGKKSFAMLDTSEEASDAAWALVCPLWHVPKLVKAKEGAKVIVELPILTTKNEPYPLVSWHNAGKGKVMFVATDNLWRLRFMRGDYYHAKFWGQAIPFLALSRLLGENKQIQLEAEAERPKEGGLVKVRAGEKLLIHADVKDEFYRPATDPQYKVYLERISAETQPAPTSAPAVGPALGAATAITLTAVAGAPGLFEGFATPELPGRYVIRVEPGKVKLASQVDLLVEPSDLEQRETAMNETLLRNMANESGGKFLTIGDLPALPGMLEGGPLTVIDPKNVELWDRWPFFVLFLLFVGAEWFLRRRFHLI